MDTKVTALLIALGAMFGCGTETVIDHGVEGPALVSGPARPSGEPAYHRTQHAQEASIIQVSDRYAPLNLDPKSSTQVTVVPNEVDQVSIDQHQRQWLRDHHVPHQALNAFLNAMEPANTERCANSPQPLRGNGVPQITHPTLDTFDSVRIEGPILVFARHATEPRVLIRADGNVVPRIQAETIDGTAVIGLSTAGLCLGIQPVVLLEGPGFNEILVTGSANLEVFDLNSRHVRISVERFSNLQLHGQVTNLEVNTAPFSNLAAEELKAVNIQVNMETNSFGAVRATKSVSGHLDRWSSLDLVDDVAHIQTTGDGEVTVRTANDGIATADIE